MRKRFEQQLSIGQFPISETKINSKSKNSLDELLAALKAIYCTKEYNERIFSLLEKHINAKKKKTGRSGMDLWCIFVLAQVRLCLNLSYDVLHNLANNHITLRQILGIEKSFGYDRVEFSYQNIYDNITMLSDELVAEINVIVLEFGHKEVFKKKESTALRLKTDSFVVESNVHFPTDYNLLWDSTRKCLDTVSIFLEKYKELDRWRKIENWHYEIKGLMRELGKKQLVLHLHEPLAEIPSRLANYRLELSEDNRDLTYTYDTQQNRTGITALLSELHAADVRFNDLETSQTSLEDIFVDLVSKSR